MEKLPILIIIPHGGDKIPEEMEEIAAVEQFELLMSSDTSSNDLFAFEKQCSAVLSTHISKLFVDLNSSPYDIPPKTDFGLIKKFTPYGKNVFQEDFFPDEISISALVHRYYIPFQDAVSKILKTNEIELVIECHTINAIGTRYSDNPDRPNPLVRITNFMEDKGREKKTAPDIYASILLENLKSKFEKEQHLTKNGFQISAKPNRGNIVRSHFGRIPYLRLDISRGLFLNDSYFNPDFLKIDQIRIKDLRKRIFMSIEKMYKKIK